MDSKFGMDRRFHAPDGTLKNAAIYEFDLAEHECIPNVI